MHSFGHIPWGCGLCIMFSDYFGLQFRIERNKYEQGKLSYSCVGLRQEVDKSHIGGHTSFRRGHKLQIHSFKKNKNARTEVHTPKDIPTNIEILSVQATNRKTNAAKDEKQVWEASNLRKLSVTTWPHNVWRQSSKSMQRGPISNMMDLNLHQC